MDRRKVINIFVIMMMVCFSWCGFLMAEINSDSGINALILVPKNFGLNYQLLREEIDQYGWNVYHTGVSDTITACPSVVEALAFPPVIPELKIGEIDNIDKFDCLIITPAAGSYTDVPDSHTDIINSPEAINLIKRFADSGKPVFSTCAGVRVLAAADLIRGKQITGSPKFQDEYEKAGANYIGKDKPPMVAGNIITSVRGQTNNFADVNAISSIIENNKYERGSKEKTTAPRFSTDTAGFEMDGPGFARIYGGSASEGAFDLLELDNGDFMITGYTFSGGDGDADLLIARVKKTGELDWMRTYGGGGNEYGYGIAPTKEGGFLAAGFTTSYGSGDKDVYLVKIDDAGNIIWEKEYGGQSWEAGRSVCVTDDNHYLVCGFTHSFGAGEEDIYLIKVDSGGHEIWSKTYGGERVEVGNTVIQAQDGNYIVSGTSGTYAGGNTDFYLMIIDKDGAVIGDRAYQGKEGVGYGYDWCRAMIPSINGGYIMTGISDCNQLMDAMVVKTDADWNKSWNTAVGPGFYHFSNSVAEASDGRIFIGGALRNILGNGDIYLIAFNPDGSVYSQKRIKAEGDEYCRDLCLTRDGGLALLGYTDTYGQGKFDIFLIKIDDINLAFKPE
ncbi:MAG: DJ-1/PfpI family protein [Candidatus Zixiibacteriota bacterium]